MIEDISPLFATFLVESALVLKVSVGMKEAVGGWVVVGLVVGNVVAGRGVLPIGLPGRCLFSWP